MSLSLKTGMTMERSGFSSLTFPALREPRCAIEPKIPLYHTPLSGQQRPYLEPQSAEPVLGYNSVGCAGELLREVRAVRRSPAASCCAQQEVTGGERGPGRWRHMGLRPSDCLAGWPVEWRCVSWPILPSHGCPPPHYSRSRTLHVAPDSAATPRQTTQTDQYPRLEGEKVQVEASPARVWTNAPRNLTKVHRGQNRPFAAE